MQFGVLLVLNDDHVKGGMGFSTHPRHDMEIVSITLSGALRHKDSMGNEALICKGEVQIMSAGTGIEHSEHNANSNEPVDFLQIWVKPEQKGLPPHYDQKLFPPEGRQNRLQTVVSPLAKEGGIFINQQARFHLADLNPGRTVDVPLHGPDMGIYVFVIEGSAKVGELQLNRSDGAGIWEMGTNSLGVEATSDARMLFIEVPMMPDHSGG